MDTLNIIKNQVEEVISIDSKVKGLQSVLVHIERAEQYLNEGKKNNDDHLFTDVIYRTNHAFEGILKEAYTVLTGKDSSIMTPSNIEQYLLENNVLNIRVVELLTNYRQDWRNTSTHDYNLFFDHSEAFLAIVSVSAFVHVLLNQILEKIYYELEKQKVNADLKNIRGKLTKEYKTLPFIDQTIDLLKNYQFDRELNINSHSEVYLIEKEILASLSAFLSTLDNLIKIQVEPRIKVHDKILYPDLLLEKKDEKIIIEIKMLRKTIRTQNGVKKKSTLIVDSLTESRLMSYMTYTEIKNGIILFLPFNLSSKVKFTAEKKIFTIGGLNFSMAKIIAFED